MSNAGKPNILFIMEDDIGWLSVSAYNHGITGCRTPNIDRIAKEGALFTDFYGQQSGTAGRSAFVTGQSPVRTRLTKRAIPGVTLGLSSEDPTIGQFLKQLGYATGQFGKNQLGDLNEYLPTVHGFDEFFGNSYPLNAKAGPEQKSASRGVLRCKATEIDDPFIDPQFGRVGKQTIEDAGCVTAERIETLDEEFLAEALDFMDRKTGEGKPWLCCFNGTRMRVKESGICSDAMIELDGDVFQLLGKIDELGVADNTIVVFTAGNGGETPMVRVERENDGEGAFRVPFVMRWPELLSPGTVVNSICSLEDMVPTFAAAAGEPHLIEKVKRGYDVNGKTCKVYLDGCNLIPFLSGESKEPPRNEFLYWTDDGELLAARTGKFKIVFLEQRSDSFTSSRESLSYLTTPKLFSLPANPLECGESKVCYDKGAIDDAFRAIPIQGVVERWLGSFKEFPIRQRL